MYILFNAEGGCGETAKEWICAENNKVRMKRTCGSFWGSELVVLGEGEGKRGASGPIRSQRWFRTDSLCILQPSSYPNGSSFIWSCWKPDHKSKKYTSAHSKNPSRASLPAYWVGFTRRGKREGAGGSCLCQWRAAFYHNMSTTERKKEMKGGEGKKKSLRCGITSARTDIDNNGLVRDDSHHANTNQFKENGQRLPNGLVSEYGSDVKQSSWMWHEGLRVWIRGLRRTPGGSSSQTGSHFDLLPHQLQTRLLWGSHSLKNAAFWKL